MVDMLARDGLLIDLDELQAKHPGSTIGRPHFALCLVEAGVAESVQDAFERFLDPGCKYYIRRHFLSVEDAAELIRSAGGKPVIAHPRQYKLTPERFTELMERARACGVAGLECYYSGYDAQTVAQYLAAAEQYGFVLLPAATGTARISRISTSAAELTANWPRLTSCSKN